MKNKIKDVTDIEYLTKGHRGMVFVGLYKKKKVAIKINNPESEAINRMENEANYLKILNKKGIGPKLLFYNKKDDYFIMDYIGGETFPIFLEHSTKKNKNLIKKIIKQVFLQCYRMDKLNINKEEMQHPYKHIIIEKTTKKPVLLDFERCHKAVEPVNVTQFSAYIISGFITEKLNEKGIKVNRDKVIAAAKKYKKEYSKKALDNIIKLIN